jgi:uncharacterized protein (TIGR02246 family)
MNPIEVVRRYNQAWNGRDANAIVQLFAEGGTYSNPHAGQGLTGEAIGNYAKAVWAALPDMTAELVSVREIAPGQVAHEWLLPGYQHRAAHGRLARHGALRHHPGQRRYCGGRR